MLAGGVIGPRGSLPHGPSKFDAKRGGHSLQADLSLLIGPTWITSGLPTNRELSPR